MGPEASARQHIEQHVYGSLFEGTGGYLMREGECNHLFFAGKKYQWHPVAAVIEFRKLSRFSHISIEDACDALGPHRAHLDEPPRDHLDFIFHRWSKLFGLWCRACQKTVPDLRDVYGGQGWHWSDYEACYSCAGRIRQLEIEAEKKTICDLRAATRMRAMKLARLEKEAADLAGVIRGFREATNERFNGYRRRSRKNAGALEKTRKRQAQSHRGASPHRLREDRP